MLNQLITGLFSRLQGNSIRARVARSAVALTGATAAERCVRLIRNMVLTRLLAPGDLGLMALVTVTSMFLEAFTEIGVKQSVIQNKQGDQRSYLNIAWWFQGLRGIAIYLASFAAVPWVCQFYAKPELMPLMRVAFLAIIFKGFVSPRSYLLEKDLRFILYAILSQGSGILATALTIGLAFLMKNIWAIVIGLVAEAFFLLVLSYVLCPFLPGRGIKREHFREIMRFARGMVGLPILSFLAFRADVFVLGKMVSTDLLGIYSMALALAQIPFELFSRVVNPILLPVFARKQDDIASLRNGVLKMTRSTAFFGMPLVVYASVCSDYFLSLFYDPLYAAAAAAFILMCIYLLIRGQGNILGQVYMAMGKPHMHRRFVALRAVIIFAAIYPGIKYFGISGAAGVMLLANFCALAMQVVWLRAPIGLGFSGYFTSWLVGLGLSGIVFIPLGLIRLSGWQSSLGSIVIGGLLYLLSAIIGILYLRERSPVAVKTCEVGTQI